MLLKTLGVVMMLDGVLSAMSALPKLDTFAYRSWRDQSLIVAHFFVGALLLLSGRLLTTARSARIAYAALLAALAVACVEGTRFDRLTLAVRAAYTAVALAVLYKTTLPKT
jgi:hypothetical protein